MGPRVLEPHDNASAEEKKTNNDDEREREQQLSPYAHSHATAGQEERGGNDVANCSKRSSGRDALLLLFGVRGEKGNYGSTHIRALLHNQPTL